MINGFYMDESGNTGLKDVNQPVLCYGGILIPNNIQPIIHDDIEVTKCKTLQMIKSNTMGISEKLFDTIPFFNNFELHGKEFIDGDGFNSKISFEDRKSILESIFNLIDKYKLKVFLSVTNKDKYVENNENPDHYQMYENGFKNFVETINTYLKSQNEFAFIIADDGKKGEQDLFSKVLRNQQQENVVYRDLQVKTSHSSNLIQMADLALFVASVFFRNQYGFKARKKYNKAIVDLYNNHIQQHVISWEYK